MSLPVCRGFSDLVTSVPTVGNPITQRGSIGAPKKAQCGACRQKACPDFLVAYPRGLKATRHCQTCHRDFFGETCLQTHLAVDHAGKPATNPKTTVCFRRRRCSKCRKQDVGLEKVQRHQCGYLECPSCREYVDGETHRCFIQRAPTPQEQKKKKKRKRQGGGGLPPNEGWPGGFTPCKPTTWRKSTWTTTWTTYHPCTCFLTLKPCNPTNSTSPISSSPKPKTTIVPFDSQANIVSEIFWNGWIPSH